MQNGADARAGAPAPAPAPALIVLRGNSGSGKSTVARALRDGLPGGVAWVAQDHFRREVLAEKDIAGADNIELVRINALFCLARGRHTVVEGIFHAARHGAMLAQLAASHAGPSLFYAFDLSLDETLARHEQRRSALPEVTPDMMGRWYHGWQPLHFCVERRILPQHGVAQIVQRICRDVATAQGTTG